MEKAFLQTKEFAEQQDVLLLDRQIREILAFGFYGIRCDNPPVPDDRFEYRGFFMPSATNNTAG